MNMNKHKFILYIFIFCHNISTVPWCSCQSNSQNIETFYPFLLPPVASTPDSNNNQPPSSRKTPSEQQPRAEAPVTHSSKKAVVTAIVATATGTIVISGLFFFLVQRYARRRKNRVVANDSVRNVSSIETHRGDDFVRVEGNLKGVIVDEEGLDVLYWRKLEENHKVKKEKFNKDEFFDTEEKTNEISSKGEKIKKSKSPIQETYLLRGNSSSSQIWPDDDDKNQKAVAKQDSWVPFLSSAPPPPPLPPPTVVSSSVLPRPPRLISPAAPPPPPPPPSSSETGNEKGQVKFKPLHWDKVNINVEHSMVWDKVKGGSFRVDDELMEALFGSIVTDQKSPRKGGNMASPKGERSGPPSQIFLLDTRKSQNILIILRSLSVSRKEMVDALIEGKDLDIDVLEKLNRVAPTGEEVLDILAFDDDHTRLAHAESFLYHVLKAVPSAFTRFNAMLFKSNFDSEILHLKKSLQTLESGCKELRTRGLLLKLLEAVLKAGNRMNAGTSRGNAQAFSLTSLQKLSDVKSTDGKTTLLHFVVEEVVRAEGKRCVISRNHSSSRNKKDSGGQITDSSKTKEDKENEYITLGLPIVGGISSQFSNLKKSATLNYDTIHKASSTLSDNIAEIRKLVGECAIIGGGQGYIQGMKNFLDAAEAEIRVVKTDFTNIMELVKRTTEYYQAGASKDKGEQPLQIFVLVKDFLEMVDQVCIDITRNMQKRKSVSAINGSSSSSSPKSPAHENSAKFPLLTPNFMSDKSKSSSSDSDEDDVM